MRVAVSVPLYPPVSLVGAWVSTHQCLAAVVAAGHTVDVVPYMRGQGDQQYGLDGVQVRPGLFFPEMADGADLILSHLGDDQQASRLAKEMGIPSVRMVHGRPMNGHNLDDDLAVFNSHTLARTVQWKGPQIEIGRASCRERVSSPV